MKESKMVKTVVLVIFICILLLGGYAYVAQRNVKSLKNHELKGIDRLLLYDLEKEYPHSPRDVVKLYSEMLSCVYNQKLKEDDLKNMVRQMRKLYDKELAEDINNTEQNQINALNKEMEESGKDDHKITSFKLMEASQIEYGEVDGKQAAMVDVTYTLRYGNEYPKQSQTYILVQDDEEHWKILGWQDTQQPQSIEKK